MRVLLFANIGTGPTGFYHVGDEAMFYQTYLLYKKYVPKTKLFVLTTHPSYENLDVQEITPLAWPQENKSSFAYLLKLVFKIFIYKISSINLFSPDQFIFIKQLQNYDRIHFTGGGNLTSLFSSWFHFSCLVIFTGWVYKKEITLTSQTIGPFNLVDRLIALTILNLPNKIILRQPSKLNSLLKYGIFLPKIESIIDTAYFLKSNLKIKLPYKNTSYRIGLSIHSWKNYTPQVITQVVSLLTEISSRYKIQIVTMPHVFTKKISDWDRKTMHEILIKLPKKISVIRPSYNHQLSPAKSAQTLKGLSRQVDFVIATRYHALVFALSENTPCLSFDLDDYYNQKNSGILALFYGSLFKNYVLDLDNIERNTLITSLLVKNLGAESKKLKRTNKYFKKIYNPKLFIS